MVTQSQYGVPNLPPIQGNDATTTTTGSECEVTSKDEDGNSSSNIKPPSMSLSDGLPHSSAFYKKLSNEVFEGRALGSKLQAVVLNRAELESRYAKDLKCLADSILIDENAGEPTFKDGLVQYKHYLSRLAESHEGLANNLLDDVFKNLHTTITNHKMVGNCIAKDYDGLKNKDYNLQEACAKATEELFNGSETLKRNLLDALLVHPTIQAHKLDTITNTFLTSTIGVLEKEQFSNEKMKDYEKFRDVHKDNMKYITAALVDMDNKRQACCRDSLVRCLVYELAALRNNTYEAEKLSPAFDAVNLSTGSEELKERLLEEGDQTFTNEEELDKLPSQSWMHVVPLSSRGNNNDERKAPFLKNIISSIGGNFDKVVTPLFEDVSTMWNYGKITKENSIKREDLGDDNEGGFNIDLHRTSEFSVEEMDSVFEGLAKGTLPIIGEQIEEHILRYYNVIEEAMNDNVDFLTIEMGELLKDELSSSLFRGVLLEALSRILDDTGGQLRTMLGVRVVAKLIQWGLDWSDQQNDSQFGQWVVCKARLMTAKGLEEDDPQKKSWHWPKTAGQRQKIKAKIEARKKRMDNNVKGDDVLDWSVQHVIYNHNLLNRVTFWEKALTGLLGHFQILRFLETWWSSIPSRYNKELVERYRLLYYLKLAPCLPDGLHDFPVIMQSYGIADVQIEHMIMKVTVRLQIPSDLISEMYTGFRSRTGTTTDGLIDGLDEVTTEGMEVEPLKASVIVKDE